MDLSAEDAEPDGGAPHSELLHNADGSNDRYNGIGRTHIPGACTATLLDVGGADAAPAYALTSGHCTTWWDSDRSFEERALDHPGEVTFRFFTDTVDRYRTVATTVAAFSSMRGTDLAILRLDESVGALRADGIEGIPIATALPAEGAAITNVGAPQGTIEDPGEEHLRLGRCSLGEQTPVVEFEWLWPDALANDCPDVFGGSSGSPLLDASGAIFAVLNTGADEPPRALCHLNHPCEIEACGPAIYIGRNYAMPVAGLGACFVDGVLDLAATGCPLASGPVVSSMRLTERYERPNPANVAIHVALTEDHGLTHYRAKFGLVQDTDCYVDEGYAAAVAIAEAPVFAAPLPTTDGITVVCLRGGTSAASIQPPSHAVAWLTASDSTPPPLPLPVRHDPPEATRVRFWVEVEDPTYGSFEQKSGPADTTDCDDLADYHFVNVLFGQFTVESTGGPTRVCVVAYDRANNRSEPMEWTFFE
ncbi:trypsin-like serine peptidase [Nannocystis radixulma]|uniref:Serine protease n=1 Tax=Nannocystis radixulma TaxID=2995305 RepID=A0ABT5AXY6_9BACT|nr:serine protease [Nannocystis radixulma]MDC0666348.1 serine protease [Nannocystis radixulma]